jgi:alpha-glucosidase
VCALAARHGLGVFLYVSRRHLERGMPRLAGALREAGAAGVKFGSVAHSTPADVSAVAGWAHACRAEGLLVDAHDDLFPGGLQLLLPNLLSFEAIRGNEAFPPPVHSVRLAMARGLAGPADYTPVVHSRRRVLPPVHVLCLPVLIYCPLQHLYLYSAASQVAAAPAHFRRVWGAVPTTWARTVWLGGHPDTHAAVARQSAADGSWYVAAVCSAPSAAGPCRFDSRAALRTVVGCGRRARVEAFADAGDGAVAAPPPARVGCVCDPGQRLPLERAELAAGQAVLLRVFTGDSDPDSDPPL